MTILSPSFCVLSGLSRLGIDPWDEAARLSQLPKERAIEALGGRIARLPPGVWQVSDAAGIAARLVELLPKHDAGARFDPSSSPPASPIDKNPTKTLALWLIAGGIAVSLLFGLPARVERIFTGDSIVAPILTPAARP